MTPRPANRLQTRFQDYGTLPRPRAAGRVARALLGVWLVSFLYQLLAFGWDALIDTTPPSQWTWWLAALLGEVAPRSSQLTIEIDGKAVVMTHAANSGIDGRNPENLKAERYLRDSSGYGLTGRKLDVRNAPSWRYPSRAGESACPRYPNALFREAARFHPMHPGC